MDYAYLAGGKLFVSRAGSAPKEIRSEFGKKVQERHLQNLERHGWKSQQGQAGFGAFNMWNRGGNSPNEAYTAIAAVAPAPSGAGLYYVLLTSDVGGLFYHDFAEGEERRIFHRENFVAGDLTHHPSKALLACSAQQSLGRNLALLNSERFELDFITEGDSRDEAPCWVPDEPSKLLYQSSGIGRDRHGNPRGAGPVSIEKLNIETGDHETLLEDEAYDYLCPKAASGGSFYCIRRKYEGPFRTPSHVETIKDLCLAPYRFLKAVYGFLNMMTQVFGKESLVKAGTGEKDDIDLRAAFIKGRLIDLKRDGGQEDDAVVPADWELVRWTPQKGIKVVAKSVGDYALLPDEGILYTNGRSVFHTSQGASRRLHKTKHLIESLVGVGSPS